MQHKQILFIEICNYTDYPIGGYLTFAKQMLTAFGNQLVLVGMATDDTPVGRWIKKEINGVIYDYFSVRKVNKTNNRPLIPERLKNYLAVRKYRKKIFSKKINNVFIQTPEVLFALKGYKINNLCVRIPGVENPLTISRYWYGKYLAKVFDYFFFRELTKAGIILATANKQAIENLVSRNNNVLPLNNFIQFPTRINTDIFHPIPKIVARNKIKLNKESKIIVTTGRLSELKGWILMLKSFMIFRATYPDSLFAFLGDGEDRKKFEEFIIKNNLEKDVLLTGRLKHESLSLYLNAADIYIMGSYVEGWATSLVEAIACEKPVVCTNFSSANELVINGFNGFVINKRDEYLFSEKMIVAVNNINAENLTIAAEKMKAYATSHLKASILRNWKIK